MTKKYTKKEQLDFYEIDPIRYTYYDIEEPEIWLEEFITKLSALSEKYNVPLKDIVINCDMCRAVTCILKTEEEVEAEVQKVINARKEEEKKEKERQAKNVLKQKEYQEKYKEIRRQQFFELYEEFKDEVK